MISKSYNILGQFIKTFSLIIYYSGRGYKVSKLSKIFGFSYPSTRVGTWLSSNKSYLYQNKPKFGKKIMRQDELLHCCHHTSHMITYILKVSI